MAFEPLFGWKPEPSGLGAGGDHQRIAGIDRAVAAQKKGPAAKVHVCDVVGDEPHCRSVFGLQAHLLSQPRPLDGAAKPG